MRLDQGPKRDRITEKAYFLSLGLMLLAVHVAPQTCHVYVKCKVWIGIIIRGLSCVVLGSELCEANPWIGCEVAHAVIAVVSCVRWLNDGHRKAFDRTKKLPSHEKGWVDNVPRRTQQRKRSSFFFWAILTTDGLCARASSKMQYYWSSLARFSFNETPISLCWFSSGSSALFHALGTSLIAIRGLDTPSNPRTTR